MYAIRKPREAQSQHKLLIVLQKLPELKYV